jgi:hypothetical protein
MLTAELQTNMDYRDTEPRGQEDSISTLTEEQQSNLDSRATDPRGQENNISNWTANNKTHADSGKTENMKLKSKSNSDYAYTTMQIMSSI